MTSLIEPGSAPRSSNDLANERTELATNLTLMAADRSLMAWIRTGLSLISFGFSIYKILQGFQASAAAAGAGHSPRTVGLFLTGLGTFAVIMGTVEYWQRRRDLVQYGPVPLWRPAFVMAVVMSLTGVAMFFGITSKLL